MFIGRGTTAFPTGRKNLRLRQWRPPVPAGPEGVFLPHSSWLNVNIPRSLVREAVLAMVRMNRMAGKIEKWPYVGEYPLPSTGPGASSRKMRPRSEKDPCSENQITFSLNRFRFRRNVVLDHPLCRRGVMRICQTSLQSYRLEFFADPSSARQHSGLQLADVWARSATEGAEPSRLLPR